MACIEHECFECGHLWTDNEYANQCPECKSTEVSNWFDESPFGDNYKDSEDAYNLDSLRNRAEG